MLQLSTLIQNWSVVSLYSWEQVVQPVWLYALQFLIVIFVIQVPFTYKIYPEIHWVHFAWFVHDKQFDVEQQYKLLLSKIYWLLHELHTPEIIAKSQP